MRPVQTFISGAGGAPDPSVTPAPAQDRRPVGDAGDLPTIAYLSPEFGVSSGLPQYAGGLGVLAGDHLKAASELGVPIVGIGLFYDRGYFRQRVDDDGTQHADYPELDPVSLGLEPVPDVAVEVEVAGTAVVARLWRADVGRVPLYLLDTDVDDNDPHHRRITDRLYGGGPLERLRQELILGIGGTRALTALGVDPGVFHLNEGHAGFSLLERLRRAVVVDGLEWDVAIEAIRPAGVFTTHTPVPAGIDRFEVGLMAEHFAGWCDEVGVGLDRLLALGREPGGDEGSAFNMAVLCLRLCGTANGVSQLHGEVSRAMFAPLWPGVPTAEAPIGSITNGVDGPTWVAPPMASLLADRVGADWFAAPAHRWAGVADVDDAKLWAVRNRQRAELVEVVRSRLAARSGPPHARVPPNGVLDPDALTIGFARRFATYKRAALLFGDPDALVALVSDADRPVQFVFAGKAHPNDTAGQALIAEVVGGARQLGIDHRLVFVEDYDMELAAALVAGCDVWLNTPVRPMEACGTSGMKAALNGGLNCSIPDGWWAEWGSDEVGWVVPSDDDEPDPARRDTLERESVLGILSTSVVPAFFDRDRRGIPRQWLARVRASLTDLGPRVLATRMVDDYVTHAYLPAARAAAGTDADVAADRVRRRRHVADAWDTVAVREAVVRPFAAGSTDSEGSEGDAWVAAEVALGGLDPTEVVVEAVWGPVDPDGGFGTVATLPLSIVGPPDPSGAGRYEGAVRFGVSGEVGVTVRVVPRTPAGVVDTSWGLVRWAQATSGSPSSTA